MNFVLHTLIVNNLKKYIHNFENIELSVFQGEISLSKISLVQKAINHFIFLYNEHIRMYKGNISKLKLIIPWSSLNSKSILINGEDINIHLHFSNFDKLLPPNIQEKNATINKEEFNFGTSQVEEGLIKKFIEKVIHNVKIKIENIKIFFDLYDEFNFEIILGCLDIFPCDEEGNYIYSDPVKRQCTFIGITNLVVKLVLNAKNEKNEIDIINLSRLEIILLNNKNLFKIKIRVLDSNKVVLLLNVLKYLFNVFLELFFKDPKRNIDQPITFFLIETISNAKQKVIIEYEVNDLNLFISPNVDSYLKKKILSSQLLKLNIEHHLSTNKNGQYFQINIDQIKFSLNDENFLVILNNSDENDMKKFCILTLNDIEPHRINNIELEINQETDKNYNINYSILSLKVSHLIFRLHLSVLFKCFNFINDIQDFINENLNLFFSCLEERRKNQFENLKTEDDQKEIKVLTKNICNYKLEIIKNRFELIANYKILDEILEFNFIIYISSQIQYEAFFTRKSKKLKQILLNVKNNQFQIECSNGVKILEIIKFEVNAEKKEKIAIILSIKLILGEFFVRLSKNNIKTFLLIMNFYNDFLEDCQKNSIKKYEKKESLDLSEEKKPNVFNSKTNVNLKIAYVSLFLGEELRTDLDELEKISFKEIFELNLINFDAFMNQNYSENKNDLRSNMNDFFLIKIESKLEGFFIDNLFSELKRVISKTKFNLNYSTNDTMENKLEFLNPLSFYFNPGQILNLLNFANFTENNDNSQLKFLKNETNKTIYVKYHSYSKKEKIVKLLPGRSTLIFYTLKSKDDNLNRLQIGIIRNQDSEEIIFSNKFFWGYDNKFNLIDFVNKITIKVKNNEEIHFLLRKTNFIKDHKNYEVICVFSKFYVLNMINDQTFRTKQKDSNEVMEMKKYEYFDINKSSHIEKIVGFTNREYDLEFLVDNHFFIYDLYDFNEIKKNDIYFDSVNDFYLNEMMIYFKKNNKEPNVLQKLYAQMENNEDNNIKCNFYIDVLNIDGIKLFIIKPFLFVFNRISNEIILNLQEFKSKESNEFNEIHKLLPVSINTIISSTKRDIYYQRLNLEFRVIWGNFKFISQKIIFKNFQDSNQESDTSLFQFTNENGIYMDVKLIIKKIGDTTIIILEYPLEIENGTEYFIVIKIKKYPEILLLKPYDRISILRYLNIISEGFYISILQNNDLVQSNANAIEVQAYDLAIDQFNILSFNFAKIGENFLNVRKIN